MKHIYITRTIKDEGISLLKKGGFHVDVSGKKRPLRKAELISIFRKKRYDGVITLLTDTIDKDVIDAMDTVSVIANMAVGFNNIDIDYARSKGILVCNVPASAGTEVAEHTIALMFAVSSKIVWGDSFVRKGSFVGWDPMLLKGPSLYGKKLGILGMGNIGQSVALFCHDGLGMDVLYYDIQRNLKAERDTGAVYASSIEKVLAQSDVVSVHVPLNRYTHHLLTKKRLLMMKPDAILVNTARGAVIDEKALVEVLSKKQIAGAGLDVFEYEPQLTAGLSKLQNVVLSPHIASATAENRSMMAAVSAQNIIDGIEQGTSKNKVN